MADNKTKKTWVTVLIAMFAITCVLAIGIAGSAVYFFTSHAHSTPISMENGTAQIETARQRFAGQTAMIEFDFDRDEEPVVHQPPADAHAAPITTIRALIYSQPEGKMIEASLPAWFFRMMPNEKFSFLEQAHFRSDRVRLTFADVERHGPGLILDGFDRKGSRLLVWAE